MKEHANDLNDENDSEEDNKHKADRFQFQVGIVDVDDWIFLKIGLSLSMKNKKMFFKSYYNSVKGEIAFSSERPSDEEKILVLLK